MNNENEETVSKKELSTEQKIDLLMQAIPKLEEDIELLRDALVRHTTNLDGTASLPLSIVMPNAK